MKSVIKIPAGYGLHDLKGIGGSVIRQYDWYGDTLQVWSTDLFHLKLRKGESIVEYIVSRELKYTPVEGLEVIVYFSI